MLNEEDVIAVVGNAVKTVVNVVVLDSEVGKRTWNNKSVGEFCDCIER